MKTVFVEDLVVSKYGTPSRDLVFCSSDDDCVSGETCGSSGHCGGGASVNDAGVVDTGAPDTGPHDTGTPDTGRADSGIDSGVLDGGKPDATVVDSVAADTGVDTGSDAAADTGVDAADTGTESGADAGGDGGASGTPVVVTCSTTTTQSGSLSGGYESTACGTSGALAKQDGKTVTWSASSSTTKTVAYATYVLSGAPTSMTIDVSYLGDDATEALWYWTIWSPSTGAWVPVGDDSWAGNWSTTAHKFTIASPASYVDATGHVKVRFQTKASTNSAELDRMVLEVTY